MSYDFIPISNDAADQRLCFRYTDSTIPLLLNPKFQPSSHLLWLYSPVCVGPGQKTGFLTTRLNLYPPQP